MTESDRHPAKMLPGCAKAFGTIQAQNVAAADKLDDVRALIGRLFVSLEGNGSPGIKTRIDRLEQCAKREARRSGRTLAMVAVGAAVLSSVVAIVALVYSMAT